MILNRVNSAIDRTERNKLNENFDIIERGQSSIQNQINQLVVEGDSSVEAAQARISVDDTVYITLKERLDTENIQVNQQLEEIYEDTTQKITQLQVEKAPLSETQRLEVEKATKNELTSAIRPKADKVYVDGLISGITTVQPRDIYYSVSALETALPNGDEGLYLVFDTNFADGAHSYIWSKSESLWKDTGLWQGNGIVDNSVTPTKTSFAKLSPNLFDESTVIYGQKANTTTGQLEINTGFVVSDYIPVTELVAYKRNKVAEVVGYDNSFARLTHWGGNTESIVISQGVKWVRLNIPINNLIEFQFEQGTVSTAYKPYGVLIDDIKVSKNNLLEESVTTEIIKKGTVTVSNLEFAEISENLFNVNTVVEGYFLAETGVITANNLYNYSDYIEVEPSTVYGANKSFGYVLYDKNKQFISGRAQSTANVTTTSSTKYIRLSILNTQLVGFAFNKGGINGYVGHEVKIKNQSPLTQSLADVLAINKQSYNMVADAKDYEIIDILSIGQSPSSPTGKAKVSNEIVWRNQNKSYKVLSMGLESVELKINLTNPLQLEGIQEFDLAVYIPNVADILRIELNIPKTDIAWARVKQQSELKQGWNFLRYYTPEGNVTTWESASEIRIITYTVSNADVVIYIGGLQAVKPQKAKILMVCDHGYSNFKATAFEQLKVLGIPSTFAINPGRLGASIGANSRILNQTEIDELAIDPYAEFSYHTWNPTEKATSNMTADEIRVESQKCLHYLRKNGLVPKYLWRAAFVQNLAPNASAIKGAVEAYATPNANAGMEVYPFRDSWNINRVEIHGKDNATIDGYFDKLKKTHGTFVFYTHDVSTEGGIHMTPTELAYFMGKVEQGVNEGWLEGVTYSQLRTRYEMDFNNKGFSDFFY